MDNQKFQVLPYSLIRQGVLDSIEEYFSNKFEEYQTKKKIKTFIIKQFI